MRLIDRSKAGIAALGIAALIAGVARAETPEASQAPELPADTVDKVQPGDHDYTSSADGYLYVYEHVEFGGAWCAWFISVSDYRITDCGDWNDHVSSVWNNSVSDVAFYEHIYYRGASLCLPAGASWARMPDGWNDVVSSHGYGC